MDAEKAFSRRSFGVILLFMGVLCLLIMALGYWGIIHISERLTALASAHPDIADFKAVANWVADARAGFIRYGAPLVAAGVALWSLLLWLAIAANRRYRRRVYPHLRPVNPRTASTENSRTSDCLSIC